MIRNNDPGIDAITQYQSLFENSLNIILFIRKRDGQILEANVAAVNAYQYSLEELLSLTIYDLRSSDTFHDVEPQMAKADLSGLFFETCHRRKNGEIFPVEVSAQGIVIQGEKVLLSIIRDITHRRQAEETLWASNNLLSLYIRHSPIYTYIKEVSPSQGIVLHASDNFTEMIGIPGSEMTGKTTTDLFPREFAEKIIADDWSVVSRGEVLRREEELNGRSYTTIKFPITLGAKTLLAGYTIDMTDRKQAEQQIQQLVNQLEIEKDYAEKNAKTDSLTKLANRRYFDEALSSEFYRAKRSGDPLSLIMIDIDHFKQFNDTYGHLAGDDCLRQVAAAIETIVLRAPDIAARYGGEEFVVILPGTDHQGAATVAEKIRSAVEKLAIPHSAYPAAEYVTISLGVATIPGAEMSAPESVVALADKSLYFAKERGRNRVEVGIFSAAPGNKLSGSHSDFVRLVWKVTAECGNATIDEQHRKLFEIANELLSAVIGGHPKDECVVLIDSLLIDIVNHFRDEEVILRAAEYPFYESHRQYHNDLVVRAAALSEKYGRDELSVGELFSFLAYDVIALHMFTEDKKFVPYIAIK